MPKASRGSRQRQPKQAPDGFFVPSKIETLSFVKPANFNQRRYVESLLHNTVTITSGSAGVGKSLLALHTATCLINHPNSDIERILYIRANVGVKDEKDLGSVPGDIGDKTQTLAYPVWDNLSEFMGTGQIKSLFDFGKIQVMPVALMRGRSLANTFVIVDEAQNLSPHGIRTVLSRISHGSKIVLLGDNSQADTNKGGHLNRLCDLLANTDGVGVIRFTLDDIMRHPMLKEILIKIEGL